jgi:hypothetical protein
MRRPIVLAAVAAGAAMALWTAPSSAMQPVAKPAGASALVTRTADGGQAAAPKKAKHRPVRVYRGDRGEYWHYRLSAGRWLHNQYVNAGYPVDRYQGEITYVTFPGGPCCGHHRFHRHWPWMGHRHWHGYRYWPWMGHRHHHRHW